MGHYKLEVAVKAARLALIDAENAFFDPMMVPQLYFPEKNLFSVYSPLIMPLTIPLMRAIIIEIKRWRWRCDHPGNIRNVHTLPLFFIFTFCVFEKFSKSVQHLQCRIVPKVCNKFCSYTIYKNSLIKVNWNQPLCKYLN